MEQLGIIRVLEPIKSTPEQINKAIIVLQNSLPPEQRKILEDMANRYRP